MDLEESLAYQKAHRKRPKDIILAFSEPKVIGEILLLRPCRVRLIGELSREEFERRLRITSGQPKSVAGSAALAGARVVVEGSSAVAMPPPGCRHFYAARLHD